MCKQQRNKFFSHCTKCSELVKMNLNFAFLLSVEPKTPYLVAASSHLRIYTRLCFCVKPAKQCARESNTIYMQYCSVYKEHLHALGGNRKKSFSFQVKYFQTNMNAVGTKQTMLLGNFGEKCERFCIAYASEHIKSGERNSQQNRRYSLVGSSLFSCGLDNPEAGFARTRLGAFCQIFLVALTPELVDLDLFPVFL